MNEDIIFTLVRVVEVQVKASCVRGMGGASVAQVAQVQHDVTSSMGSGNDRRLQPADGSQSACFVSICLEHIFPSDCFSDAASFAHQSRMSLYLGNPNQHFQSETPRTSMPRTIAFYFDGISTIVRGVARAEAGQ